MTGTLLRSDAGVWYVRRITESKDTPSLQTIEKFPLYPADEIYFSKYTGSISIDIEFEITESLNFISKGDEPANHKTVKYAKIKNK
jgi:hypothetical protein